MAETLEGIIESAVDSLDEEFDGNDPYMSDRLHEIADGSVPVYNATIMEVASNDYSIMLDEPELGPAFGGEPTPVNVAAANIYEKVSNALYERLRELEDEWEEFCWEWDEAIEMDEEFDRVREIEEEAREIVNKACDNWYWDQFWREVGWTGMSGSPFHND